jgi:hypothetical protein
VASGREVTAVAVRYQGSARSEKESMLSEFTQRIYPRDGLWPQACDSRSEPIGQQAGDRIGGIRGARIYGDAVRQALILVWEAADRICAKRLKQIIPVPVSSMERHGHLQLDPQVRAQLLRMSAATMDRLLKAIREVSSNGRRRSTASCGAAQQHGCAHLF